MDHFDKLLEGLVKKSYVNQGLQNEKARQNQVQVLLNQKKLPVHGWSDQGIEIAIHELSIMDSNNFASNAGVGEREGRIFSSLVARRHYNLSHGIGRSGDISEVQPKAAGSSIIYKLTNSLVLHAMEIAGLKSGLTSLILPMATGMSLTMCFIALKTKNPNAKYIIWPRIDQKSCLKSISTAGLTPLCVENRLVDGQLLTDVAAIQALLEQHGDQVLCVLSTTSCFAPRQPDLVDEIAVLCKRFAVGHVINNAYGVQCEIICKRINRAMTIGRADAVVQSTDKNFMVPVGGAVVVSPSSAFIDAVAGCYPGRASMTPILDLFITLLSMGQVGYRRLLTERLRLRAEMLQGLHALCDKHALAVLPAPGNSISTGVSLASLLAGPAPVHGLGAETEETGAVVEGNLIPQAADGGAQLVSSTAAEEASESAPLQAEGKLGQSAEEVTPPAPPVQSQDALLVQKQQAERLSFLGSMLFQRCVSGCRVVTCTGETKKVAGLPFIDWGAHCNTYPCSYFTVACSVGIQDRDVALFLERLDKVLTKYKKQCADTGGVGVAVSSS